MMLIHNYGHHGEGLGGLFARIFGRIASKVVAKTAAKTAFRAAAKVAKKVAVRTIKTAAKKAAPLAREAVKEAAKEALSFGAEKATEGLRKVAGAATRKGVPVGVVDKIVSVAEGGIKSGESGLTNIVEQSLKRKTAPASTPAAKRRKTKKKPVRRIPVGQALIEAL